MPIPMPVSMPVRPRSAFDRVMVSLKLCVVFTAAAQCSNAAAQLIAYEPFEYEAGSSRPTWNGGIGWSGGWTNVAPSAAAHTAAVDGLQAPSGGPMAVRGRAARISPMSLYGDVDRVLPVPIGTDNGELWLSVLVRLDDRPTNVCYGGVALGFSRYSTAFIGLVAQTRNGQTRVRPTTSVYFSGANDVDPGMTFDLGDTVLLVSHVTFRPGNERIELWVNPPAGAPLGTPSSVNELIACNTIQGVRMTVGDLNTVVMDELRLGRTVADVLPLVCPPDFSGDGFLTFEDFDEFVLAFEEGAIRADFDADGFLTFEDFDAFVAAFDAGC